MYSVRWVRITAGTSGGPRRSRYDFAYARADLVFVFCECVCEGEIVGDEGGIEDNRASRAIRISSYKRRVQYD